MKNILKWILSFAWSIALLIMIGAAGYGASKLYHLIPESITNVFETILGIIALLLVFVLIAVGVYAKAESIKEKLDKKIK